MVWISPITWFKRSFLSGLSERVTFLLSVFLYFAWILFFRRITRGSRADNQGSLLRPLTIFDGMFRSTWVLSPDLNSFHSSSISVSSEVDLTKRRILGILAIRFVGVVEQINFAAGLPLKGN